MNIANSGMPSNRPLRNSVFVSVVSSCSFSQRDKMPLTPAILPCVAMSNNAEAPISIPPMNEAKGVNSVSITE